MIKSDFWGAIVGIAVSLGVIGFFSVVFETRIEMNPPDTATGHPVLQTEEETQQSNASPFNEGFIIAPEQPADSISSVAQAGDDLPRVPQIGTTEALETAAFTNEDPTAPAPMPAAVAETEDDKSGPSKTAADATRNDTQTEIALTPEIEILPQNAPKEEQANLQDITTLPPLTAYSVPFDNPEGKPLLSIILMDTGVDLDRVPVGLPALGSFPAPVTFAVDSRLSDASQRMRIYREKGFEVLALVDLPQETNARNAEAIVASALSNMPQVVGILEGVETGLQASPNASQQIIEMLSRSGHGIVLQNNGLNSIEKKFRDADIPTATVFRDFDSEDQTAIVIRRFLDQAAFRARQDGAVIMLGRLRSETVSALLLWGLQDRASRVAISPISTVLDHHL